ncbi:MAG: hypothetical protein HOY79_09370 [Streptomyces sp.]|nr:hypothetical protein [Streptomyces sp.]
MSRTVTGARPVAGLVQVVWISLYLPALYGAAAIPAHSAVLAQPLEVSGQPLATVTGPSARATLLEKSRNYRETHAILRRLDQGLLDDSRPELKNLEAELAGLHEWVVSGSPAGERLPANVSVVDASLALGPWDDWWANGVRGVRFALIPGLPAAVLGSRADGIRGAAWQATLSNDFGLPHLVLAVLWWLVTWVAAGFVLGALAGAGSVDAGRSRPCRSRSPLRSRSAWMDWEAGSPRKASPTQLSIPR